MKTLKIIVSALVIVSQFYLIGQVVAGASEDYAGEKYALLIGIHDYSPPFKKLQFCYNDILALKERLLESGYREENIVLMHDTAKQSQFRPSKSNIQKQLRLRLGLVNTNDDILVAFSGHGVMSQKKSYLCPYDAVLTEPEETMVSVDGIYEQLRSCRANRKLLLVDACRDEPVMRGFRTATTIRGFAEGLEEPPKGILVLASCEPGEWSAADPDLKHGVFSYYLNRGLEGEADRQYAGNRDGTISVFELYSYVHEKTKKHVANSHGISQRPVLRGEISGSFDLARVPVRPKKPSTVKQEADRPESDPSTLSNVVRSVNHPLLKEAKKYLDGGEFDKAIKACTALIDDSTDVAIRRKAREGRGAAYLARGKKEDIENALIDHLAVGKESLQVAVTAGSANLMIVEEVKGTVHEGQVVSITSSNGDWFWVDSVSGSNGLNGFIEKDAVVKRPVATTTPATQTVVRSANNGEYYYDDSGYSGSGEARNNHLDRLADKAYDRADRLGTEAAYRAAEKAADKADRAASRGWGRGW